MFAILAHIRPLDLRTNMRVDVRVASTAQAAAQGLGGFTWESAITRRPRASMELFALDLSAGTRTPTADLQISLSAIRELDARALHWKGAPIVLYRADELIWPAQVEFTGTVTDPRPDLEKDSLTLSCAVSTSLLDKPLLTKQFNDTTFTFDADKRTIFLPAGYGLCKNLPPLLFDSIRNFFMVDGYGNLQSISWVGEGLSTLGASFADYADYAALKAAADAAAIPPGRWATCIAQGILALGAPPTGTITCHASFGFGMTGALIRRVLDVHAGVPAAKIADASLTSLDTQLPYPVHHWTDSQVQVKELVEALAAGCNASSIVTLQGQFAILRPFGGSKIGKFVRRGFSDPAVSDWKSNDVLTPYWRVTGRAARPIKVMTLDEISYEDDLVDRGLYDPAEVYRQGNIVWLRNKSQWLYSNETAAAGHAPPDGFAGDAWWINLAPAPDATDLRYADNTTLEALQPAEPDAQITRAVAVSDTTVAFTLDASGNAIAAQFPRVVRATMSEANYDVTLLADWSIVSSNGILATIDNGANSPTRGRISITNVSASGTIQVTGMRGPTVLTTSITITTKGGLADKTKADTIDIKAGAVTAPRSFSASDVEVLTTETTLIETAAFMLGDSVYGAALAMISFVQDSSTVKDAGWTVRVYVDTGSGYGSPVRDQPEGSRTNGGDTRFAHAVIFPVTLSATTPIKVKVTAQSIAFGGGSAQSGTSARYIRIDLLSGAR